MIQAHFRACQLLTTRDYKFPSYLQVHTEGLSIPLPKALAKALPRVIPIVLPNAYPNSYLRLYLTFCLSLYLSPYLASSVRPGTSYGGLLPIPLGKPLAIP